MCIEVAFPERTKGGLFKGPAATSELDGGRRTDLPNVLGDGSEDFVDLEDEVGHDGAGANVDPSALVEVRHRSHPVLRRLCGGERDFAGIFSV
jgi:hypothetical protein